MTPDIELVQPHNLEAERAVLGAILIDNAWLATLQERLSRTAFFRAGHRLIWDACLELDAERVAIDFVTLREQLLRGARLEDAGGPAYLAGLIDGVPRTINAPHYADIVREKARQRQLIAVLSQVRAETFAGEQPVDTLIHTAERLLLDLGGDVGADGFVSAERWMADTAATVARMAEEKRFVTGVATGFSDLDYMTRGLQPGDLCILAGRPSMGKTALALQIALTAAEAGTVAFFSLEMSKEQLGLRAAALVARIPAYRIMAGKLFDGEFERLMAAFDRVANTGFTTNDDPSPTPGRLRARTRRLAMDQPLRLVVIDYLTLIESEAAERREQEVAQISRAMKAMARELKVPLLVLSQLNRANESRADKRPQLSDLRESGALEQDADLVMLIHRPEYYEQTPTAPGLAELILAKQRNGPTGVVQLKFIAAQTRFEAWDGASTGTPHGRETH